MSLTPPNAVAHSPATTSNAFPRTQATEASRIYPYRPSVRAESGTDGQGERGAAPCQSTHSGAHAARNGLAMESIEERSFEALTRASRSAAKLRFKTVSER